MDQNALIAKIGQLIVSDARVDARPWDGYALIAYYDAGRRTLSGFRYQDGERPEPATPRTPDLGPCLDALRSETRIEGKEPWGACVVRIVSATGRITVDFAYEAASQWALGPDTLAEVSERARPG